jgi:hypothetical protein
MPTKLQDDVRTTAIKEVVDLLTRRFEKYDRVPDSPACAIAAGTLRDAIDEIKQLANKPIA